MQNANRILLWVIGAALLLAVSAYAYWFLTNFERYSEEVKTGMSPEARKNHFLAAEYFLQRSGQTVESHAQRNIFSLAPSPRDTIFIGHHSSLFVERNNRELYDWVKAGGQLVLVADDELFDSEQGFLLIDELGAEPQQSETIESACDDETDSCADDAEPEATDDIAETQHETVEVTFRTDHPGSYRAAFLAERHLRDVSGRATVAIGNGEQHKLLRYPLGNGSVTLLSDTKLFSNSDIGKLDHAYLFYQLTESPGTVWIFFSADMPSLLQLMWKHAPQLLLVTLLFLLMAGWTMLQRSGPRLRPQYAVRRNLLEHLNATAEYSWRIDKARQLFSDNRHAIEQAWRRRHPQLHNLEQEARCEWIGEKTGLSARAVERSLYGEVANEQDFIRATSVLQQLATRVNHHSGSIAVEEETETAGEVRRPPGSKRRQEWK